MYKNYLIVASKKDRAGINIITQLSQFPKTNFQIYLCEKEIIYTENLDMEKINQFDFIIFASKHKSEKNKKALSVHAPGNWRNADFGGESRKVCKTSAEFIKQTFEKLNKNAEKYHLRDYEVTLECTHHGPLINKPCIFIEIGSTESEWKDNKAGFAVAKTISEIVNEFKPNPYNEIGIGIGGPHYCPNFNKVQLNSNFAISHIISGYSLPLTKEMLEQAVKNTEEEINFAILDWKGMGSSEQRQQGLDVLNELHLEYKKTSDIKK